MIHVSFSFADEMENVCKGRMGEVEGGGGGGEEEVTGD